MKFEAKTRRTRAELQAETRAALVDAAERVFVERGFPAASVEAISAEAGYTRGAFYSNFSSKEELFAELLMKRVYSLYAGVAEEATSPKGLTLSQLGERLAEIQRDPDGRWLFRLWLEVLAHAGRDERIREIAAGFWSGTRATGTASILKTFEEAGVEPPVAPDRLASAMIALDIGLAVQHHVDPAAVPLDAYPELFELLFGRFPGPG